jgi:hypothetical protein
MLSFSPLTPLTGLLLVWAAITLVFIVIMVWRSLVAMREDDQLFLNPGESLLEEEQKEVQSTINKLDPYAKGFGFASAGLAIVIAGFWLYQGIMHFNGTSTP